MNAEPCTAARIVIVGAGHAGGTVAALLRQQGHEGPIALIGAEAAEPYQRPPLSKAWLKGEADLDALMLKGPGWYGENGVDLHVRLSAEAIDRDRREVRAVDGRVFPYDVLILATGARARRLTAPGGTQDGVLELRTFEDAERLKGTLAPGVRLAIVGGGYVGLEAAASARALGAEAVVIEREARTLARVASPPISAFFEAWHRERGVDILTGAAVEAFEGGGRIEAVRLADGRRIACDAALVGVGAVAEDGLARAAGLACDDGVIVDGEARTSDPAVFAIGDCTRRPLPLYGADLIRLESVPNALEQARQVAAALTGRPAPAPEVPWFWSDQYDLKLQIAGLPADARDLIVRGDPAGGRFAVFHLAGDLIRAVEAVNAPPEFMMGKQLIGRETPVDRTALADPLTPMKAVARG